MASAVIALNCIVLLLPAVHDLMDRMPEASVIDRIAATPEAVEGVSASEKLLVRRIGMEYVVDLHVQADPRPRLRDAHILSGKVKGAVLDVAGVLIHTGLFEEEGLVNQPWFKNRPGIRLA